MFKYKSLVIIYLVLLINIAKVYGLPEIVNLSTNDAFLKKADFNQFNNWDHENFKEALNVFIKSCERIKGIGYNKPIFPQANLKIKKSDFYSICKIAEVIQKYENKHIQIFFEKYFVPYMIVDKKSNYSLFTGYYIPRIKAKTKRDATFKYPIYRRPPELTNGVRYYTRKEIESGAIDGKNLELIYTNDPVELFYLQIQGSGIAYLVDKKKVMNIGFDGKNNHEYSSIETHIKQNSLLPSNISINQKTIKKTLKQNINIANDILNTNKSYVFFREIKNDKFIGAFGSELIPFRTMAVDKKYIPLGFPLWVETKHNMENKTEKFNRIIVANDTGAAIRGAVRGDIFFGFGKNGENQASFQYSSGQYFLLIPIKIAKKL